MCLLKKHFLDGSYMGYLSLSRSLGQKSSWGLFQPHFPWILWIRNVLRNRLHTAGQKQSSVGSFPSNPKLRIGRRKALPFLLLSLLCWWKCSDQLWRHPGQKHPQGTDNISSISVSSQLAVYTKLSPLTLWGHLAGVMGYPGWDFPKGQ